MSAEFATTVGDQLSSASAVQVPWPRHPCRDADRTGLGGPQTPHGGPQRLCCVCERVDGCTRHHLDARCLRTLGERCGVTPSDWRLVIGERNGPVAFTGEQADQYERLLF